MTALPRPLEHLPRADLGEGPWWDIETQRLYWVDIVGHKIHRFDPKSRQCDTHDTGTFVSFVVLDATGALVVGLRDGVYRMDFGAPQKTLLAQPSMPAENRFNDGLCDPRGRLWAGTMHVEASPDRKPTGALYRLEAAGLELIEPGVGISNGLGWSPDGRKMYFAETFKGIVWVYDYDLETGRAAHRRVFVQIDARDGVPDGLTVDSRGYVFVAIWRAGRVNIYDTAGTLDDAIVLPVSCPTSCAFGDADLRTLYITSACRGPDGDPATAAELAGRVFSCRMDAPGNAEARMA